MQAPMGFLLLAARTNEQAHTMAQSGDPVLRVTQRRASELARGVFASPT
jgi:hypothetical protein